jgi:hypothetical protein
MSIVRPAVVSETSGIDRPDIKGVLLLVDGEVRLDSMPLADDVKASLARVLTQLIERYERSSLPPKVIYLVFEGSQLLCLMSQRSRLVIWLKSDAAIAEIEKEARRLLATAHLKSTGSTTNLIRSSVEDDERRKTGSLTAQDLPIIEALALEVSSTEAKIGTWEQGRAALVLWLSDTLAEPIAARMVDAAFEHHRIAFTARVNAQELIRVGAEVCDKIPNKVLRRKLLESLESLAARIP